MLKRGMGFWVVLTLAVVLLLFAASVLGLRHYAAAVGWEKVSAIGQSFEIVSTLFSALAFAFVIVALLMQQKELKEQQEQIRLQLFEHSFFEMLKLHHEMVFSYRAWVAKLQKDLYGRDALRMVRQLLQEKAPWRAAGELSQEGYDQWFCGVALSPSCYLGHYLRNLCALIGFVEASGLDEVRASRYAGILKAQLSDDELALVFFDGLTSHGQNKMKPLAEKYGFFEDLMPDNELRTLQAKRAYAWGAFGNSAALWRQEELK